VKLIQNIQKNETKVQWNLSTIKLLLMSPSLLLKRRGITVSFINAGMPIPGVEN
jgi:hypothetical protein